MTKRETGKLCSRNLYCIQNIQILKDHIFGGGGWEGQLFCDFKVLMHFRSNWKLEVFMRGLVGGRVREPEYRK